MSMVAREKIDPAFITIPSEEVIFHPHSFADDAGRLFQWNGKLCRGINHAQAPLFDRLFREGVLQSLVERGLLIETAPTDLAVDGYAMVVSHRCVPFVSYPNEWCAAMLRDAALTIIDLAIELAQWGFTLRDAHPWNILFESSRPVWVDLTSIVPQQEGSTWPAYDEFCRFCYYPLILMAHGQERIARSLLPEYEGVLRSELLTLLRGAGPSMFTVSKAMSRAFGSIQRTFRGGANKAALSLLRQVKRDLGKIQLPSYESRHRRRRNESMFAPSSEADWTERPLILRNLFKRLQPDRILDLSRGPVWTSTLPATMGFELVSIDSDAARVSALYEIAREKNLPILPLIVDFIKPTPSVGYSDHYSIAANERLKCDLVLALGLTSRLASENYFSPDLIAEGLASFTKRWLIVDFDGRAGATTDREDGGPRSASGRPENFADGLLKHFRDVNVVSSGANSTLLLCQK
jgi:hypothetical protein